MYRSFLKTELEITWLQQASLYAHIAFIPVNHEPNQSTNSPIHQLDNRDLLSFWCELSHVVRALGKREQGKGTAPALRHLQSSWGEKINTHVATKNPTRQLLIACCILCVCVCVCVCNTCLEGGRAVTWSQLRFEDWRNEVWILFPPSS